jgi:5-formyltetrahydrofolate cyclo-ligase
MADLPSERSRLRAIRRAIDPAAAGRHARAVRDAALAEITAVPARIGLEEVDDLRVGAYLAHDGELDPEPLAAALRDLGASTWYPVVADHPDEPLVFRRWDGVAPLEAGAHRISVPPAGEETDGAQLSIVIVPLVGFDLHRNRLGMGAGHYDRTFAARQDGETVPWLLGVAHDEQQVDSLTPRSWDVPLDVIVTPTRVLR